MNVKLLTLYGLGLFLVLALLYFPIADGMLIDDGISGLYEIREGGWKGYLESYGHRSFYFVHYGLLAFFYSWFGLYSPYWFILFVALHALNAVLIFQFFHTCLKSKEIPYAFHIAAAGTLLFAFSPYQLENVAWAATLHYGVSLALLMGSFICLQDWMQQPAKWIYVFGIILFFILNLLTLEVAFVYPLLFGLYIFFYTSTHAMVRSFLVKIGLPLLVVFLLYLLAYHAKNGQWIPSREAQPYTLSLITFWNNFSLYVVKILGLTHFFPFVVRNSVYTFCNEHTLVTLVGLFSLIAVLTVLGSREKLAGRKHSLFLWIAAAVVTIPFMHYYFMVLFRNENDRYQYFLSVFVFQAIAWFIVSVMKEKSTYLLLPLTGLFLSLTFRGIQQKKIAIQVHHEFIQGLPATNNGITFILNAPSYCADHYLFRNNDRVQIAYDMIQGNMRKSNIVQVVNYHSVSLADKFSVIQMNQDSLTLVSETSGTWWMNEHVGAEDYEQENFAVHMEGMTYHLRWKKRPSANDRVIYFSEGKWIRLM
jgi:hypothetical protein